MPTSRTNPTCAACPQARNAINGRYCPQVKAYVEYIKQPICKQTNF